MRKSSIERKFDVIREECPEACAGDGPLCESMNCQCGRIIMANYLGESYSRLSKLGTAYSLIFYADWDAVERNDLEIFSLLKSSRKFKNILKKAGLKNAMFFGGYDIVLKEHRGFHNNPRPMWLIHIHGVLITTDDETTVKRKIRKHVPKSSFGSRPLMIEKIKTKTMNVSYQFKQMVDFRRLYNGADGKLRKKYHFSKRGRNKNELQSFMSNNHLLDWLLLYRLRQGKHHLTAIKDGIEKRIRK